MIYRCTARTFILARRRRLLTVPIARAQFDSGHCAIERNGQAEFTRHECEFHEPLWVFWQHAGRAESLEDRR